MIFRTGGKQGQTLAPLDETFQLLGGGAEGRSASGGAGCSPSSAAPAIVLSIYLSRRRRQRYDLAVRPMWVDVGLGVVGCVAVLAGVGLVANSYTSPDHRQAHRRRLPGRDPDRRDARS